MTSGGIRIPDQARDSPMDFTEASRRLTGMLKCGNVHDSAWFLQ